MQELLLRFRPVVRVFATLVAILFTLASVATEANAYSDLPCCPQRSTQNDFFSDLASSNVVLAQQGIRNVSISSTTSIVPRDDTGCSCCDLCNGYFDAHLQGLNLETVCAIPHAPHQTTISQQIYTSGFISTPIPPPPRHISAQSLIAV